MQEDALRQPVNARAIWNTFGKIPIPKLGGKGVKDTDLQEVMEPKAATHTAVENTMVAVSLVMEEAQRQSVASWAVPRIESRNLDGAKNEPIQGLWLRNEIRIDSRKYHENVYLSLNSNFNIFFLD